MVSDENFYEFFNNDTLLTWENTGVLHHNSISKLLKCLDFVVLDVTDYTPVCGVMWQVLMDTLFI